MLRFKRLLNTHIQQVTLSLVSVGISWCAYLGASIVAHREQRIRVVQECAMSSTRDARSTHWEDWTVEDFRFVRGMIDSAQEQLAIVSCRAADSRVRARAWRVEVALRAVSQMLDDGSFRHRQYIQSKLDSALGFYDLRVKEEPGYFVGVREQEE